MQSSSRLFSSRCHTELDDVRFVVRRVVVLGIAGIRLNIRFGHCTSCLFDNSSVKLCKHDTPLLFVHRKVRIMKAGFGAGTPQQDPHNLGKLARVLKK